jgi:hypothetical protein
MKLPDYIPGWLSGLLKMSAKFDDKGDHHPEHPAAKHFDGKSTVMEKGDTSGKFKTKEEFDKREVGNPEVESKYKTKDHGETTSELDKDKSDSPPPPTAKNTPGETTAVSAPSKYAEPLHLEREDDVKPAMGGHVYLPFSDKTPRGEAGHKAPTFIPAKVKAAGQFGILKEGDLFNVTIISPGVDNEVVAKGLELDEAEVIAEQYARECLATRHKEISKVTGLSIEALEQMIEKEPEEYYDLFLHTLAAEGGEDEEGEEGEEFSDKELEVAEELAEIGNEEEADVVEEADPEEGETETEETSELGEGETDPEEFGGDDDSGGLSASEKKEGLTREALTKAFEKAVEANDFDLIKDLASKLSVKKEAAHIGICANCGCPEYHSDCPCEKYAPVKAACENCGCPEYKSECPCSEYKPQHNHMTMSSSLKELVADVMDNLVEGQMYRVRGMDEKEVKILSNYVTSQNLPIKVEREDDSIILKR